MAQTVLVTGANQGLGRALVTRFCQRLPEGSSTFLGARDEVRGQAACDEIAAETGRAPQLLVLDVGSDESVASARKMLESQGIAKLDVVIHNAACRIDKETDRKQQVRGFVNVNNFGTVRMLRTFAPIVERQFLVVASGFGQLLRLPEALQPNWDEQVQTTLEALEEQQGRYVTQVESGEDAALGYPEWINIVSKIAQVTAVKIAANECAASGGSTRILACCPGLIQTEASRPWFNPDDFAKAPTPMEAALGVLAILETEEHPAGVLVQDGKVLPWRKSSL